MVDSIVDNWSMRTQRRAEIRLDLSVKTPVTSVEDVIAGIKKILQTYTADISSYSVFFKDINKNGITIVVEYFTDAIELALFDTTKQNIQLKIKKLLEENTVEFSGEANTIVINNESREN